MDDFALLREFFQNRSQEAFRQLVDRHLAMVYSAACRMVRDPHLAEEVAQTVFSTLVQKGESLSPPQTVAGWLYNTARHIAMHAVRTEQRRREREQKALAMQSPEGEPDISQVAEHLETAMAQLEANDRDALVLRYLENLSLRKVGEELGISEDAARMRVNRALERLRVAFGEKGVAISCAVLATTLSSSLTSIVPAGLAATIASTALAGSAAATITQGATATMNLFNLKTTAAIVATAVTVGTGTYFVQEHQIERLAAENQRLTLRQEASKAGQLPAAAVSRASDDEIESLRKEASEVHRLRNELTQLRRERDEAAARETENQKLIQQLAHARDSALAHLRTDPRMMEAGIAAQRGACRANLRQIESAKEQWALENKKIVATPTAGIEAEINAYFRNSVQPVCPANGIYTYGPIGTAPTCSLAAAAGHTF
ncbi:MAG: sigma-70 family RNA polymerase sigma factor [Verrucomicrobia bacterium]|nr:sigma-70 family RNA polymerase sigma factor [Verrucomicrobiota bacterium]